MLSRFPGSSGDLHSDTTNTASVGPYLVFIGSGCFQSHRRVCEVFERLKAPTRPPATVAGKETIWRHTPAEETFCQQLSQPIRGRRWGGEYIQSLCHRALGTGHPMEAATCSMTDFALINSSSAASTRASSSSSGWTYPRSIRLSRLRDSATFAHSTEPEMPASIRFCLRSDKKKIISSSQIVKSRNSGFCVGFWWGELGFSGVNWGFALTSSVA